MNITLDQEISRIDARENKQAIKDYSSEALSTIECLVEQFEKDNIKCDNKSHFLFLIEELETSLNALVETPLVAI